MIEQLALILFTKIPGWLSAQKTIGLGNSKNQLIFKIEPIGLTAIKLLYG